MEAREAQAFKLNQLIIFLMLAPFLNGINMWSVANGII